MRLVLLASVLSVSCVASASFELVLALDTGNHMIHRVDGERSIYLGNFGANRLLYPTGMAVQQSTNRVHVFDANLHAFISFDYNTGEKVAEAVAPSFGYAQFGLANNGDFLIGDFASTTARRYSQSGALLATFTAPAGAAGTRAMTQAADGNYYVAWSGINAITRHNSAGALLATVVGTNAALSDCRQMFVQNNQVVISGGSSGKWMRASYSGTAAWGSITEMTSMAFAYGVSGGHFSTIYSGGYVGTGNCVLNSFNLSTGGQMSTYTIPGAGSVTALGTVVAPEPHTVVGVLMAGGLGLLSRRKRRG